jgi:hypothetical protein
MADGVKREFGSVAASHPAPYATRGPPDADRKPVAASATAALGSPHPPAASASPTPHKIQLKSADMKDEMQKEAFEISRLVIPLFFLSFPPPLICSLASLPSRFAPGLARAASRIYLSAVTA